MDWSDESNWHEAANIFPLMSAAEVASLAADIKQNGLQHPIVLFEGKVLDGRNRLLACRQAGVEPQVEEWNGKGHSPIDYVISQNLKRRQLTRDQQAATAAELSLVLSDEARKRQIEAGKRGAEGGRGRKKPLAEISAEGFGKAAALAARRFPDVTTSAVERVLSLERTMPGTLDRIKRGEIKISDAEKQKASEGNKLSDLYGAPPFSFLDPQQDYWKKRKLEWTSIFDPVLCELMIRWFTPVKGGHILDPFSIGSTRGIVATHLGYQYTGVEWREGQAAINAFQAEAVRATKPSLLAPNWIQGTASQLDLPAGNTYDQIWTSAPSYNEKRDRDRWPSYLEFLNWYKNVLAQAVVQLKENRFAVVVIEELADEEGLLRTPAYIESHNKIFEQLGLGYYNRIILNTAPELPPWTLAPHGHAQINCYFKGDNPKVIPTELGIFNKQ